MKPAPTATGTIPFAICLPRVPINHDQLTVKTVQRPEAKITVLEDLRQRHVTVEGATQQSINRRGLKQLVPPSFWSKLAVPHHLDPQRVEEFKLAHIPSRR